MSFSGKVVIITGASSGVGAATAKIFANERAAVVLVGRSLQNLEDTKRDCLVNAPSGTPDPFIITADLSIDTDIERIVQETVKKFNKIDILVNCAGIGLYNSLENTTMDEYDKVMKVNARAPFLLTKLCIPYLEATQGNIVNVSSIMGFRNFLNVNAYSSSKGALDQFAKCTALELAPKRIRVNVVSPGFITGNFQKKAGVSEAAYNALVEASKESYPLGRAADPTDVAEAIVFLASDKANYLTGVVLPVDGGKSCQCPR